jgi:hypothetical protein
LPMHDPTDRAGNDASWAGRVARSVAAGMSPLRSSAPGPSARLLSRNAIVPHVAQLRRSGLLRLGGCDRQPERRPASSRTCGSSPKLKRSTTTVGGPEQSSASSDRRRVLLSDSRSEIAGARARRRGWFWVAAAVFLEGLLTVATSAKRGGAAGSVVCEHTRGREQLPRVLFPDARWADHHEAFLSRVRARSPSPSQRRSIAFFPE